MRNYRKKHKANQLLASLLSITFLCQLTLLPLVISEIVISVDGNYYAPLRQYQEAYIINGYTGNELLNYIEVKHLFGRNLKDFQRIFNRNMDVLLLPVIILGIILLYTLTCTRRLKQRISILSTSLGGHAPPVMIFE